MSRASGEKFSTHRENTPHCSGATELHAYFEIYGFMFNPAYTSASLSITLSCRQRAARFRGM